MKKIVSIALLIVCITGVLYIGFKLGKMNTRLIGLWIVLSACCIAFKNKYHVLLIKKLNVDNGIKKHSGRV